jgi:hypothetical protein
MGVLNVLLYPIVYVKDSTALAHFNFLGIMSAFYVIVVLVVQMPAYMNKYFNVEDIIWAKFEL